MRRFDIHSKLMYLVSYHTFMWTLEVFFLFSVSVYAFLRKKITFINISFSALLCLVEFKGILMLTFLYKFSFSFELFLNLCQPLCIHYVCDQTIFSFKIAKFIFLVKKNRPSNFLCNEFFIKLY